MAAGVGGVHVAESVVGGVLAPDDAGEEERDGQDAAIDGLDRGAGEVEFVAEPVDIEEWGGELVEQEDRAVEVAEGPLKIKDVSALMWVLCL